MIKTKIGDNLATTDLRRDQTLPNFYSVAEEGNEDDGIILKQRGTRKSIKKILDDEEEGKYVSRAEKVKIDINELLQNRHNSQKIDEKKQIP